MLSDTTLVTLLQHWQRYAALGDSSAWSQRLAGILRGDAELRGAEFEFAEFGEGLDPLPTQVQRAIDVGADLVSIQVGGGETSETAALAEELEGGVASLKAAGCDVLLVTCAEPRFAGFNAHLWNIARNHAVVVLDLWGTQELGHRQLASRAAHALGVPYFESRRRQPTVDSVDGFKR